jgi:hypothetical protein
MHHRCRRGNENRRKDNRRGNEYRREENRQTQQRRNQRATQCRTTSSGVSDLLSSLDMAALLKHQSKTHR